MSFFYIYGNMLLYACTMLCNVLMFTAKAKPQPISEWIICRKYTDRGPSMEARLEPCLGLKNDDLSLIFFEMEEIHPAFNICQFVRLAVARVSTDEAGRKN